MMSVAAQGSSTRDSDFASNEDKSAIDVAWNRKLLGYSFRVDAERKVKRRASRRRPYMR
ncbi:MAG: hypothetical protein R3B99_02645 [Polyangiales bacterium]